MRKLAVLLPTSILLLCLVAGCGITIVSQPLDPNDRVNPSDRSITIKRTSLSLSARVQDTAVGGFSTDTPLTSFYVDALNNSQRSIALPLSSFTLVDDQGTVYQAVDPSAVNALLLPEYNYLVPFPYVSFLDVVAVESQRASSAIQSEQPYVMGRGLEQDPAGTPFPEIKIAAGARAAGAIFFEIDLYMLKGVRLQVDDPTGKKPLIFPFSIEK